MPTGTVLTKADLQSKFISCNPHLKIMGVIELNNRRKQYTVKCRECNHKMVRGSIFDRTVQCENCSDNKTKVTNTTFLRRMKEHHPNLKALSEFKGTKVSVEVECLECHHIFTHGSQELMYGKRSKKTSLCPSCGKSVSYKTNEAYRKELRTRRPDLVLVSDYKGARQKVTVKSLKCGHTFSSGASAVFGIGLKGCRKCVAATMNIKGDHESFVSSLKKNKPHIRVLGTYISRTTKIAVECTSCDLRFSMSPASLLDMKYACKECARLHTGYARKKIKVAGRSFELQGYEDAFIRKLAKIHKDQFKELRSGSQVCTFKYKGKSPATGKMLQRTYRPDFYIPSRRLIVEIKSTYTAAGTKDWFINLKQKRQAVIDAGYKFALIVFDTKGERIPNPDKWYTLPYAKTMFTD